MTRINCSVSFEEISDGPGPALCASQDRSAGPWVNSAVRLDTFEARYRSTALSEPDWSGPCG